MTAQFVEIAGKQLVMLPLADYEKLMEIAEDRVDEAAFDAAQKRRLAGEEYIPEELVDRILAGEHPLKVWRQYRGMTLDGLAKATRSGKSYLSEIENGKRQGRLALWRKLAETLRLDIEDILPVDDPE